MENRGSRPFGYWDSSYRAKLRRTWIALPFCIVAAVAMPIFTAVKYGDVVSGLAFSVVLAVVWACQLMYAKSKAKAEAEALVKAFELAFAGREGHQVIGPAPAVIACFRGIYRFVVLIKTADLPAVHDFLKEQQLHLRADVAIDIDPITMF